MNGAAIVVGRGAQVIKLEDNNLAASLRHIRIRNVRGKTADSVVNRSCRDGIVDVDKTIGGKVRIESDSEQAALASRCRRNSEKGSGEQRSILDHPQLSCLQANEEPAVRGKGHCGGISQPGSDLRLSETGRKCRGDERR
jgi:hypothetical protein